MLCKFNWTPWVKSKQYDGDIVDTKCSKIKFKLDQVPGDFLNNVWDEDVRNCINRIEMSMERDANITEAYSELTNFVKTKAKEQVQHYTVEDRPSKKLRSLKRKNVDYWNDNLEHGWKNVCKAQKAWLICRNSAISKKLKSVFLQIRRDFDRQLKKARRKHQYSKQQKLIDACDNDPNTFWKIIDKIGIASDRKHHIPMEVEENGEVISGTQEVLNRWKKDYQEVYDNVGNGNFDNEHLNRIAELLNNMESEYDNLINGTDGINESNVSWDSDFLNRAITYKEVEAAVIRAKKRKALGVDEIPSELLKNDSAIYMLYKIYSNCFENSTIPSQWNQGIIHPLFKSGSTDIRNPLHYRPLTLMCASYKIYCDILNKRLSSWLELREHISDEQNGFRSLRSCMDHVYVLYNVLQNRMLLKQDTFCCYIDAKKAFDSVNRTCLYYKMMSMGVKGKIYKAVKSLYEDFRCTVRVNNLYTDFFSIPNGLKQGCVISPTLFKIYINDLASELNELNCGVQYNDSNVSLLMFADDVVIMAPSAEHLQRSLDGVDSWCKKWRMTLNGSKTQVIHYRHHSRERAVYQFKCGNMSLDYVDKYKYLDVWLQENLDMSVTVKETSKAAMRALGKIIAKFKACGGSNLQCYVKLFNTAVSPVITYSAGLWGLKDYGMVNTVLNKAGRFLLGLPPKAPNTATQGEIGWNSMIFHTRLETVRLYCRLKNIDQNRLTYKVFSWSNQVASTKCKNWVFHVKKFLRQHNLLNIVDSDIGIKEILSKCKDVFHNLDKNKWSQSLWNDKNNANGNKLRTYRLFKNELTEEAYLNLNIPRFQRSAYVKLRCGVLPLAIETGRYNRTPLQDRLCKLCNMQSVESETHFLIECPLYTDLRHDMLIRANNDSNNVFSGLSVTDKCCYILGSEQLAPIVIKTVDKMYNGRKMFMSKS
jgi:hypothetical protein